MDKKLGRFFARISLIFLRHDADILLEFMFLPIAPLVFIIGWMYSGLSKNLGENIFILMLFIFGFSFLLSMNISVLFMVILKIIRHEIFHITKEEIKEFIKIQEDRK